jgi:hypothetical protein
MRIGYSQPDDEKPDVNGGRPEISSIASYNV